MRGDRFGELSRSEGPESRKDILWVEWEAGSRGGRRSVGREARLEEDKQVTTFQARGWGSVAKLLSIMLKAAQTKGKSHTWCRGDRSADKMLA